MALGNNPDQFLSLLRSKFCISIKEASKRILKSRAIPLLGFREARGAPILEFPCVPKKL